MTLNAKTGGVPGKLGQVSHRACRASTQPGNGEPGLPGAPDCYITIQAVEGFHSQHVSDTASSSLLSQDQRSSKNTPGALAKPRPRISPILIGNEPHRAASGKKSHCCLWVSPCPTPRMPSATVKNALQKQRPRSLFPGPSSRGRNGKAQRTKK